MIKVRASVKGLGETLALIERTTNADEIKSKAEELCKRLAEIGEQEAFTGFMSATANDEHDPVSVITEATANGYNIIASGKEVCFIEFGAGVYYNGPEPYPMTRPQGIVGIGQYGHGRGKGDYWFYTDEKGSHYTHGTPAAMPMYNAAKEMKNSVNDIANEVFND